MKFTFIMVGKLKESFYGDGIGTYLKRLSKYGECRLIMIDESKSSNSQSAIEQKRGLEEEASHVLNKIEDGSCVIAFDTKGELCDSVEFSKLIFESPIAKNHTYFVIGGSNGLSDLIRHRADARIKISEMTFVHPLAMLVAVEQVYRAARIYYHEPYHK